MEQTVTSELATTAKANFKEIQNRLRSEPFKPFRIRLRDRTVHQIDFAYNHVLYPNWFIIGIPWAQDRNPKCPIAERSETVAMEDIEAIEDFSPAFNLR